MPYFIAKAPAWRGPLLIGLFLLCGCEGSFPMRPEMTRTIKVAKSPDTPTSARAWSASAQRQLTDLLPAASRRTLCTEELRAPGVSDCINVYRAFGIRERDQANLVGNFS